MSPQSEVSTETESTPGTEKLLVIDGHSMAFRAFYALPAESFITDSGQHTNAVHGFTNMLLKLIREERPTHVVLAFDLDTPTFRHQSYQEYKDGRDKTPQEFTGQIDLIKQVAEAMNVSTVTMEGYEADDIVATCVTLAEEAGWESLIVSGDRDALQLVTGQTTLMYPTSGISKVTLLDPAGVEAKYLVPPQRYRDLAALVGESADNLPGVPKVGPKTAAKWIAEYGSAQGTIDNADSIGGKVGENLRAALADVERNLQLNRLVCDLDLPVRLQDTELTAPDREAIEPLFDALQFNQIRDRLFETFAQRLPDHDSDSAAEQKQRMPQLRILQTTEDFTAALQTAGSAEEPVAVTVCLDSSGEALSTRAKRDEAARAAEALAVVLVPPGGSEALVVSLTGADPELDASLGEWLADPERAKLVHDLKDVGRRLVRRGLHFRGAVEDTLISGYLIQPDRRSFAFGDLVTQHLGASTASEPRVPQEHAQQTLFSTGEDVPGLDRLDLERAGLHGALLHDLTAELRTQVADRGATDLLRDLEIPLAEILLQMEVAGIAVSRERLQTLDADFDDSARTAADAAYDVIGHEVNLGSPKQLQTVLFDELGLPKTRRTKTGYSTDVESLQDLLAKTQNEFLVHLMDHRDVTKLRQTVTGLLEAIGDDGRIHTTYAQTVASTGRLSSLHPNLQNIPVRTAAGRRIRDAFVVGADHQTLLTADYSQIEMRIMAHLSGDEALIDAFRAGEDLHSFVGARVFGVEAEEVTGPMRSKVKAMSYGLVYGLSSYGLSKQLGIGVDEARDLMNEYFQRFGAVRDYLREVVEQARTDGYTSTIHGRRRYLPDLTSDNRQLRQMAERAALNAPIQGSAADIIKQAMLDVDAALHQGGHASRMLLQVHDELVLEVAAGERDVVEELVVRSMEDAADLSVPLDVHVGVGESWHEAAH